MKTKKQKIQEIPMLQNQLEALKQDEIIVSSPISKQLISEKMKELEDTIAQYQYDIEQPNNRKGF